MSGYEGLEDMADVDDHTNVEARGCWLHGHFSRAPGISVSAWAGDAVALRACTPKGAFVYLRDGSCLVMETTDVKVVREAIQRAKLLCSR